MFSSWAATERLHYYASKNYIIYCKIKKSISGKFYLFFQKSNSDLFERFKRQVVKSRDVCRDVRVYRRREFFGIGSYRSWAAPTNWRTRERLRVRASTASRSWIASRSRSKRGAASLVIGPTTLKYYHPVYRCFFRSLGTLRVLDAAFRAVPCEPLPREFRSTELTLYLRSLCFVDSNNKWSNERVSLFTVKLNSCKETLRDKSAKNAVAQTPSSISIVSLDFRHDTSRVLR